MESNNPFMRNVITTLHMVLLTSMYLYLHFIIEKFGIIKTQTLKLFKKPKAFKNKDANESCKLMTDTLRNIFRKYSLQNQKPRSKSKNFIQVDEHFGHLCVKKGRSILVKSYYRNPSEYNKEILINQSKECTKLIIEAKQTYIAKMNPKLNCPDMVSKTYWAIINQFLNKKQYQIYRLALVTANSFRIFIKKLKYLIDTLRKNSL